MELLSALFMVVAVGLVLGAGLPALFALGIHFLSPAHTEEKASGTRTIAARVIFALTIAAIIGGILLIARERIEFFTGWDPYPFL